MPDQVDERLGAEMVGVSWIGDGKPGAQRLGSQRESRVDLRFNGIRANEGAVVADFL